MPTMQRPSSSLSNHSAGSSAGAGASTMRMRRPRMPQRHRAVPVGPRKPSTKVSLPTISQLQTRQPHHQFQQQQQQQQQQQEQERREELQQQLNSQDDLPPSYIQSQHESQQSQSRRPLQSYTPPPTSAVTSDSSCSHPPTSVFTRADTPSSVSALSPVRTTASPVPVLEPLEEYSHSPSPAHQSPQQRAPLPLASASEPASRAQPQPTRISTPSVSSKPSTPAPDPPSSSSAHAKPRMATLPMPLPLQPPPSIDFSPVLIPFKALTLDAAQWTFSSAELQAIVSRAIRASAEPSSIRLLPLQMLDEDLVQEVERLESERAQAIAQYRFTMHRRTMLLQSLNASSGPSASPSSANTYIASTSNLSQAPTLSPAADLAQRLAEVSVTLDRLAATLVRVSDQLAQIRSLQDVHAASALAVALRKLNASYARRTREVQTLKEKLEAMEEERDEAWRVAEELAMEFDGEEEFDDVVEGDVVNGERAVAVQATLTRASRVGMKIKMPGIGPRIRSPETDGVDRGNGAPEDTMETNAENNGSPNSAPGESVDTTTMPVTRRRRANSATSRVTAARTRSVRASKASLRFPRKSSSRPPSTYSQHSTQSGHGASSRPRSRSRANSASSMRDDSPISTHAHGVSATIPDVPKIPTATELARLASVKSTASVGSTSAGPTSATTAVPPIPPVPPPIETSPSRIGSFLDMTTRPNSAIDEKGKSPETATPSEAVARIGSVDAGAEVGVGSRDARRRDEVLKAAVAAQVNGHTSESDDSAHVDASGRREEEVDRGRAEGDEAQVITVPSGSRPAVRQMPFSASRIESGPSILRPEIAARPSLHVYPPNWTRPPPDSPVDVTRGSGPHRADNGDDDDVVSDEAGDEEERALNNAFENAYAKTEMQSRAYMRSPMRTQHTQSMLPFPGTGTAAGPGNINTFINVNVSGPRLGESINEGLRRSPASDNQISRPHAGAGPFRGAAASASTKRPASLPSAQGEKPPWNYF